MIKKLLGGLIIGSFVSCMASMASADLLTPVSIAGAGTYYNSAGLGADAIIDDIFPIEGSIWTDGWFGGTHQGLTTYWFSDPSFTIDYGALFTIEDIIVSVDNNDSYRIDYSVDSSSWINLVNISNSYGEVNWGMDTMSTFSGDSEYISALDFSSVQAQYLRIFATGGDHMYSVGELQAYGTPVPEPSIMLLLGTCLAVSAGIRLRRKKK